MLDERLIVIPGFIFKWIWINWFSNWMNRLSLCFRLCGLPQFAFQKRKLFFGCSCPMTRSKHPPVILDEEAKGFCKSCFLFSETAGSVFLQREMHFVFWNLFYLQNIRTISRWDYFLAKKDADSLLWQPASEDTESKKSRLIMRFTTKLRSLSGWTDKIPCRYCVARVKLVRPPCPTPMSWMAAQWWLPYWYLGFICHGVSHHLNLVLAFLLPVSSNNHTFREFRNILARYRLRQPLQLPERNSWR